MLVRKRRGGGEFADAPRISNREKSVAQDDDIWIPMHIHPEFPLRPRLRARYSLFRFCLYHKRLVPKVPSVSEVPHEVIIARICNILSGLDISIATCYVGDRSGLFVPILAQTIIREGNAMNRAFLLFCCSILLLGCTQKNELDSWGRIEPTVTDWEPDKFLVTVGEVKKMDRPEIGRVFVQRGKYKDLFSVLVIPFREIPVGSKVEVSTVSYPQSRLVHTTFFVVQ